MCCASQLEQNMNRKLIASAFGLPMVAAIALAGSPSAMASGGGGQTASGSCSASADWKLNVKKDNGRLQVEYEVDANQAGQVWAVLITDNGDQVFAGDKTTKARSGSFTVHARTSNLAGNDVFVATATNAITGETCIGGLTFAK
jgi:hypothetical protein